MSKTTSRTNPAKRIKVVVTYEPVPGLVDDLRREFPQLDVRFAPSVEDQLVEIADADVYMGWIPRNVYEKANALKWIQVPGTGIDVVMGNVPELATNDIIVTNCKGSHAASMADHTLGMVVALAHKFPRIFADQQARKWDTASYHNRFVELEGSTMGILALGDIGAAVARRAHGFGMRVLAVDAQPSMKKPPFVEEIWGLDKLDALIAESDWFVVTAPITPATLGLINKDRITKMKHGSYLVVISRGGIIDEAELADALRSGQCAGASLDATEIEPLSKDSPLWNLDNLILSPHISAETPGTFQGRADVIKENVRRYLDGKPFVYVCDKKAGY
ncbi:MAG: D-2-hydroxyacid dehydrogenase [Chloroflexi bacterium]|nr:D-2-hydroxyacid dehydrogenase [Chloroflexota bacterium]